MDLRNFFNVKSRRKAIEDKLKLKLPNISYFSLDEKQASIKNCENMVGIAQLPMGVGGPLKIKNGSMIKDHYIPLATTEGALIASVNRGCSVIAQAGGTTVISEKIGMTRAPVFEVDNITKGQAMIQWIKLNFSKIKEITESTSHHLTLLKITPTLSGRNVYLRFHFDTHDAMGMNMVTIAVSKAVPFLEENTSSRCIAISGNMCVDKKPNYKNFIEGRGYKVWADVLVPEKIVSSVLKTSTEKIVNVAQRKLLYGSVMSGTIGSNAHFANILAAVFIATGQDPAHVGECSMGVSTFEEVNNSLYASVYLPDLVVGVVGGGTGLATQREALSIIGLDSEKTTATGQKFAEIIAGAVMAGELSLMASLAEGSLARAHKKYGRGESE